jgi:succinate dehydrogenase/fumarate reductase cytochrome b subunit (b558 family)
VIETSSSAVLSPGERRSFILRKVFSLTGVVPIGCFLVMHLWSYSSALNGRHAFESSALNASHSAYRWVLEALLVWLPLLFHASYGIAISFEARPNTRAYPYARNWSYVLQRVTGVVVLLFIGYHAYQVPIQVALGNLDSSDVFSEMCASLSSTVSGGIPAVAVGYLVGIAATCYHFANGLTNFCFSWGITTSRRASRRVAGSAGLVAIALFALGASSVIYFATGSRVVLGWPSAATSPPAIGCGDLAGKQHTGASTSFTSERLASRASTPRESELR